MDLRGCFSPRDGLLVSWQRLTLISLMALVAACSDLEAEFLPADEASADLRLPTPSRALVVLESQELSERLIDFRVLSPALAAEVRVRVLLPKEYDPQRRDPYPVSYLLHGCCSDGRGYASWTDEMNLLAISDLLDVVYVMPEGGNGGLYSDWQNAGLGGPPRWETHHIRELLPWVERQFHVRRDRAGRMLLGISMGGHGALAYAAKYPHYFGSAAALSPAIDSNTLLGRLVLDDGALLDGGVESDVWGPRSSEELRWRGHNPFDLAENLGTVDVVIRSGNGRQPGRLLFLDVLEAAVHEMSVNVHRELNRLGIAHQFDDYGFGTHTPDFWEEGLARILPQQASAAALPPMPVRHFSHRVIDEEFDVFGWSVAVQRDAKEFVRLGNVSEQGFTLSGSGQATVTSATWFDSDSPYTVTVDGRPETMVSDGAGRLHFNVDLGPPRTVQEYRFGAPPGFLRSVDVQITR